MDHMKLIETAGNCGLGGTALGAGFGGFLGSMIGNNGFGFGGRGYGVGTYGALEGATLANSHETSDKLNALGVQLAGMSDNIIQGQGAANLTACQGFSGVNNTVQTSSQMLQNSTNLGFAGLNTAISNGSFETVSAIKDLSLQSAKCCCETQKTIQEEGAKTRQLIQDNLITELQTKLCDEKSKNSSLETQVAFQKSQEAQTAHIIHAVTAQVVAQLGK